MEGSIISGLLGLIDSKKRSVKRGLLDMVSNPSDSLDMLNDRAANFNRNVEPVISGGVLQNRPLTEEEIQKKHTDLAMSFAPIGMTAWHGSPHKFDKFDLSKIGTGEGAQAYGHGLYLAESPNVAREYAQILDPMAAAARSGIDAEGTAARVLQGVDFNKQRAIDELTRRKNAPHVQGDAEWAAKMDAAISHIQGTNKTSNLYKTDIPDEAVARFLDWDKPLSQQAPEARQAITKFLQEKEPELFKTWSKNGALEHAPAGSWVPRMGQSAAEFSSTLRQQGIPGIRYLDGGSRSAGQGSSNFVVFDPEMIRILERNGQATGLLPWQPGEYQGLLKMKDKVKP